MTDKIVYIVHAIDTEGPLYESIRANFERIEEIVSLRQEIASLYDNVFNGTNFEPQTVRKDYSHSYFSYGVKSPYEDKDEWIDFYNFHTKNGGDDFYAMMQPAYREPIMNKLGFKSEYEGSCPVAEKVQKVSMLFKTNYRTIEEAELNINQLNNNISKY